MNLIEVSDEKDFDSTMLCAKKAAEKSQLRFQLGAVIKRGKTRVCAYNVNKTHPKFGAGRYKTLHAESHCILKAVRMGIDLSKCDMYVYRLNGLNCKPCPDCQRMIKKYNIRKVIYTNFG